jgi:heptosyltransferase-2
VKKILIIRLSAFGDIVQSMSVLRPLKESFPSAEIHWLVREDLKGILEDHPLISKCYIVERGSGLTGLYQLAVQLSQERYDLVYDAHSTLRTFFLRRWITAPVGSRWIARPKSRIKRFLFFKLHLAVFPSPFRGMISYLKALSPIPGFRPKLSTIEWHHPLSPELKKQVEGRIILAPSAAWEMKRWPLDSWKKLISLLPEQKFVVLGGPADTFCEELVEGERVINLAGKLSLKESCSVVANSPLIVSADTGLVHVADLAGVKGLSLIGPTAFGFPSNPQIKTIEVPLSCRPCSKDGRGKCSQEIYQRCMVEITPEFVAREIQQQLA